MVKNKMVEELILEETKTKIKFLNLFEIHNFRHEIRVLFYLQSCLILCISFKCAVSSTAVVIFSGDNMVYIGQSVSERVNFQKETVLTQRFFLIKLTPLDLM